MGKAAACNNAEVRTTATSARAIVGTLDFSKM
jgi:hypothetical protein